MLDKETVTIRAIYESEKDREPGLNQIDVFQECVERAKDHIEDERVKECLDRAQRLKSDS
ncbi:MAG: hypothetical protein KGY66_04520 [Candidatus Thermoplasmatota archaeon]|nr:hypothetical protein [Candidatus Thermoplasmatota archaeon]MBS3790162.1 hypothetical protein [Candidatus Thermoplasmatota archaeon]